MLWIHIDLTINGCDVTNEHFMFHYYRTCNFDNAFKRTTFGKILQSYVHFERTDLYQTKSI